MESKLTVLLDVKSVIFTRQTKTQDIKLRNGISEFFLKLTEKFECIYLCEDSTSISILETLNLLGDKNLVSTTCVDYTFDFMITDSRLAPKSFVLTNDVDELVNRASDFITELSKNKTNLMNTLITFDSQI